MMEIRIYDRGFNWLAATQLAESVQFSRELYDAGQFEIHIHPDKPGAAELATRGNIIIIDGDGHKSGIVEDFYVEENRNKQEFVVYGHTGNGIAANRIIVPPTTAQVPGSLGWDRIRAPAETVLKHCASMNLANAYDIKRNVPRFVIAYDFTRGSIIPWQARYSALLDELKNIGAYADMGFEIYADLAQRKWWFDVIPGVDRSKQQAIVSPVTFAMEYGNVESYKYIEDYKNYRSTGYCGGAGQDENRLIYTLGADATGLDRVETFVDCGNAANINELIQYGEQKMSDMQTSKSVTAGVLPGPFVFGTDYFIGDKVTVFISRLGLTLNTRITGVKEIWERQKGYRAEIRFGEKVPTIFSILNKQGVIN